MRVHTTIFEKLAHLTTICSGYGAPVTGHRLRGNAKNGAAQKKLKKSL